MPAVSCREAHPVTWSDCQGWLPGKHVKGEAETGLCLLNTDMEPKRGGVPREGGSPKTCFSLIFQFHVSSAGPTNQLSIVHAFETTPCSTMPSVDLAMNFNGELPEKWLMDINSAPNVDVHQRVPNYLITLWLPAIPLALTVFLLVQWLGFQISPTKSVRHFSQGVSKKASPESNSRPYGWILFFKVG